MVIGIIGAFDAEIEKFIDMFNMTKDHDKKEVYVANYDNKKIVVARSGIGKVNAAAMTQFIIDKYNVDLIINSGCAGSLIDSVKIMDVVISKNVTYHDFLPVRIMNEAMPNNGRVEANNALINLAIDSINELDSYNYHEGPIASGDCFVTNEKLRNEIRLATGCIAVDMESASIGHIAGLNSVPFVSIRTISDFADGVDNFEDVAAYKSSFLVRHMIDKLNK